MATKKAKPVPTIKNAADLSAKANLAIAGFLPTLPTLLTFVIEEKKSFIDTSGTRHTQDNAVLSIYTKTKKSTKTLFDQYFLGTIPTDFDANVTIIGLQLGEQITKAITDKYGNINQPSPENVTPVTPTPSAPLADGVVVVADGKGRYYAFIPGVSGATQNRLYHVDQSVINQFNLSVSTDPNLEQSLRQQVSQIEESGFNFGAALTSRQANLRNQEVNRQMDEIAARHPNDTNYTDAEKAILYGPVNAPAVPAAVTFPDGVFIQNSPYKLPNNPTIYIYFNQQLHGVASQQAFAKYYNFAYTPGMDLNNVRAILLMPDLSKYTVPANFFNGSIIQ